MAINVVFLFLVRFRALPITTGLKAFSDAVDIYMLDPNRKIVKRWLSRQTNLGKYMFLMYNLIYESFFLSGGRSKVHLYSPRLSLCTG